MQLKPYNYWKIGSSFVPKVDTNPIDSSQLSSSIRYNPDTRPLESDSTKTNQIIDKEEMTS